MRATIHGAAAPKALEVIARSPYPPDDTYLKVRYFRVALYLRTSQDVSTSERPIGLFAAISLYLNLLVQKL